MHKSVVRKTIPILYEDTALCIVNKPYGVAVQGGAGVSMPLTDILLQQLNVPIYPVHRLDKETAGVLITAKSKEAAAQCRRLFAANAVVKDYLAVCFGDSPAQLEGCISTPVQENGTKKAALTEYRVLAGTSGFTLFKVRLHTGRMHQIRIHLAGMGNPIIGDDKHGNFALNKQLWKQNRIKKLQLCAYQLALPIGSTQRVFTIPIPEHIEACLYLLGLKNGLQLISGFRF